MRVLMFGWEFPPFVAGGLATATLGLVKGLLGCGVDVTLVVPFGRSVPATMPGLRLIHAPDIAQQFGDRFALHCVASELSAYGTTADYARRSGGTHAGLLSGAAQLTSVYGGDLLAEVERFGAIGAEIAGQIAHDVIDAHDWITYTAGLRAREVSGRPFVAHIHATEYDRSGSGANSPLWTANGSACMVRTASSVTVSC